MAKVYEKPYNLTTLQPDYLTTDHIKLGYK